MGHRRLEDLATQNPRQQEACGQTRGQTRKHELAAHAEHQPEYMAAFGA